MPGPLLTKKEYFKKYGVTPKGNAKFFYHRGRGVVQGYSELRDKKLVNVGDAKNHIGSKSDPYRHYSDFTKPRDDELSSSVKRRGTERPFKWVTWKKSVKVSKSKRARKHSRRKPRRRK